VVARVVSAPVAFYERLASGVFVATSATESPWDTRLQHGSPPTALIAHAMRTNHPREDVRFARIAAEFLGPIPLAEMTVRTRVVRPGKRIEMLEGVLESGGREVVTARAWRIAVQAENAVPPAATPSDIPPALPGPDEQRQTWLDRFGYGEAFDWRFVYGAETLGAAAVWARPRVPLVAGEALTPLDRALLVVDSANGVSGELAFGEWVFVPPSLSVALERYPAGEWTLLEARTTLASDGLGVTSARLADTTGYFAAASQALLVERRST
jgi:hypothetical protein